MSQLRFPRVNNVIITGRATRDIELKYIGNGTAVAKISLAYDRSHKKGEEWVKETSYTDVVVWDKLAERCAEEVTKGSPVLIEGYLKTHSYKDKENNNRKVTEIIAHKVSFLEKVHSVEEPKSNVTNDDVPF